ncbi:19566_t:CDS:2, partial [Cetraspora pellucida]
MGIFAFDNATSHKAFSEDALMASKMNLDSDGEAAKYAIKKHRRHRTINEE